MTVRIDGVEEVLSALNDKIAKIEGVTAEGLLEAAVKVEASAIDRAPHATGNLRGSSYARMVGPLSAEVGFEAAYALFVHEDMEADFRVGGPKFLENALKQNQRAIVNIIKAAVSGATK
jgi:hypothetical protein